MFEDHRQPDPRATPHLRTMLPWATWSCFKQVKETLKVLLKRAHRHGNEPWSVDDGRPEVGHN
jgi:hypothetical protein